MRVSSPKNRAVKSRKKILKHVLIKRSKFSPTQIARILKEFEQGKSEELSQIQRIHFLGVNSTVD